MIVGLPSDVLTSLMEWQESAEQPAVLIFPSENRRLLRICNLFIRTIKANVRKLGFGRANVRILGQFQTSESRRAGINNKAATDQRGYTIGGTLRSYNQVGIEHQRQFV